MESNLQIFRAQGVSSRQRQPNLFLGGEDEDGLAGAEPDLLPPAADLCRGFGEEGAYPRRKEI